jgi:hypothetical protein
LRRNELGSKDEGFGSGAELFVLELERLALDSSSWHKSFGENGEVEVSFSAGNFLRALKAP